MKFCSACHIKIATPTVRCPVCGGPVTTDDTVCRAAYPVFQNKANYHFIKRLLLFLSIVLGAVCVLINYLNPTDFWWWTVAVTAILYAWIAVPHAMRRGGNAGGKILMQVVCAAAVIVLLDFETGYHAWSVNYVLPVIFCAGSVSLVLVILCNRTNWAGYVLYQAILAVFGFVPLVLYFTGISHSLVAALIPTLLAFVSIAAMLIFGDKSIKNEFRRRLRF
ncbi:MAG: DUF6320 domain-containing protein [Ruthenibacterium sp.]